MSNSPVLTTTEVIPAFKKYMYEDMINSLAVLDNISMSLLIGLPLSPYHPGINP